MYDNANGINVDNMASHYSLTNELGRWERHPRFIDDMQRTPQFSFR